MGELEAAKAAEGFNGAAGVNLRKRATPSPLARRRLVLQWGRRGEPAETNEPSNLVTACRKWLQWGRRGEPAETLTMCAGVRRCAECFNGAAGVNLRKHPHMSDATERLSMLQWGRRGEPAETTARLRCLARDRSLQWGRRGEPAETTLSNLSDPAAARFNGAAGVNLRKLRARLQRANQRSSFNGAAGVNLRKHEMGQLMGIGHDASMGPQG